jgi:hypothetical protein
MLSRMLLFVTIVVAASCMTPGSFRGIERGENHVGQAFQRSGDGPLRFGLGSRVL